MKENRAARPPTQTYDGQTLSPTFTMACARLRKHAEYLRVYQRSRKHFSASMTYFFAHRDSRDAIGPRVGLTAGRVLGKAVERNRIKRRMREAVRLSLGTLPRDVDVILHPRRAVLTADFSRLQGEVSKVFRAIQRAVNENEIRQSGGKWKQTANEQPDEPQIDSRKRPG